MSRFPKIFIILMVIVPIITACAVPFRPRLIKGSGNVIVEDRKVSGFDKILVSGAGKVIITQGDSESLSIETDDNLMEYIETKVNGNTLEIGFKDDIVLSSNGGQAALDPSGGFTFRISVIDLEAILLSGAAKFEVEKLKTNQLRINLSGAGDITVSDLNANQLDVVVSGAGNIELIGKVEVQNVLLSGFGRYQAFDLESQEADVTISGAGGADVWVTEKLAVTISGAGDVNYYGSPTVTQDISGLGRIQSQSEK